MLSVSNSSRHESTQQYYNSIQHDIHLTAGN